MTATANRPGDKGPLELSDIDRLLASETEELRHSGRRFQVMVGLGNGAGFTSIGAKILDLMTKPAEPEAAAIVALLFPSLIMFAAGLLMVGISASANVFAAERQTSKLQAWRNRMASSEAMHIIMTPLNLRYFLGRWGLDSYAALLFAAGLIYPLATLGIGYYSAAGFTW